MMKPVANNPGVSFAPPSLARHKQDWVRPECIEVAVLDVTAVSSGMGTDGTTMLS
jgi:hypothetical protein